MEGLTPASSLKGKKLYFDTNLFIYAVETTELDHPYLAVIDRLFSMAEQGEIQAITSELSLAETLVGAFKNSSELVVLYEALLSNRSELAVFPIDKAVLRSAAYTRTVVKIALADAIHVATAVNEHADIFITNDDKLRVPDGIKKLGLTEIFAD